METCNYYLKEKDLIHKLFKVYVPRYRNCTTAYTSIYQLPTFYGINPERPEDERNYILYHPVVLEMKGHPYPPVVTKPEIHRNSLLNVLLEAARKQYALEKRQKLQQQATLSTVAQENRKGDSKSPDSPSTSEDTSKS